MPPCNAGFPLVWVSPRKMYWLKRPMLPVSVCGEAGAAGACAWARPDPSAAATSPAIAVFLNMLTPFVLTNMQYCAGRQSRDHARHLVHKNQMDKKTRNRWPYTVRTITVHSIKCSHHGCAGL